MPEPISWTVVYKNNTTGETCSGAVIAENINTAIEKAGQDAMDDWSVVSVTETVFPASPDTPAEHALDAHKNALKLDVTDLALELTRRCNMKCEHCLRGDAEDLDMSKQIIDNVFSAIKNVMTLTFTGGEPSLTPELIRYALECAEKYDVHVNEVYLATNGREISDEFLAALRAWHMKCLSDAAPCTEHYIGADDTRRIINIRNANEPYGVFIDISMDPFHDDIPVENVLKLCTLPNVRTDKYRSNNDYKWVLHVGRAYWNGIGEDSVESERPWAYGPSSDIMDITLDKHGTVCFDGMVYVNAEGKILKYCDYAYDDQDEHVMGEIHADKYDPDWVQRLYDVHKDDGEKSESED